MAVEVKVERRWARVAYSVAVTLFAVCVAIQVFLAGLAVFVDPSHWSQHRSFVHAFELLPLVMLVLAFIGRLPVLTRWLAAVLLGLLVFQYATANASGAFAALHVVNALVIFWLAMTLCVQTWRSVANVYITASQR